jgi:hypothetical protein
MSQKSVKTAAMTDGKIEAYRTKVRLSFKYEGHDHD